MGESPQKSAIQLLDEGLTEFGRGRVAEAIRCWREVLEMDPEHPRARAYLRTAEERIARDGTSPPRLEAHDDPVEERGPASAPQPAGTHDELMEEGRRLLRDEDAEAALDLFLAVAQGDPERLDVENYIQMARSRLLKRYRERFAEGQGVPFLRIAPEQVMKYNLPAAAGFVLSLVDGTTHVDDLVALSGMDPFEALRILHQLLDAEILGVDA